VCGGVFAAMSLLKNDQTYLTKFLPRQSCAEIHHEKNLPTRLASRAMQKVWLDAYDPNLRQSQQKTTHSDLYERQSARKMEHSAHERAHRDLPENLTANRFDCDHAQPLWLRPIHIS
jgi:hypothetical protein